MLVACSISKHWKGTICQAGMTELCAQSLPNGQLCCQLVMLGRDCPDVLLSAAQLLLQCSLIILTLLQHSYAEVKHEHAVCAVTELLQECQVTLLAASLSVCKAVTVSSALRKSDRYCMTQHYYVDLFQAQKSQHHWHNKMLTRSTLSCNFCMTALP